MPVEESLLSSCKMLFHLWEPAVDISLFDKTRLQQVSSLVSGLFCGYLAVMYHFASLIVQGERLSEEGFV